MQTKAEPAGIYRAVVGGLLWKEALPAVTSAVVKQREAPPPSECSAVGRRLQLSKYARR